MLVLTRRPGEKVCIGADITVTLVDIKGNRIRLGVDAPAQVSIVRSELQEAIEQPCATEPA
jgi:carbon storage regulator